MYTRARKLGTPGVRATKLGKGVALYYINDVHSIKHAKT